MGFLGKLFGGGNKSVGEVEGLITDVLETLLEKANIELSFDIEVENNEVKIELYGEDEDALLAKEGQLLDSFQLFLKRVVQHQLPDERINLVLDCDGYREEVNQSLIDLAEKLKGIAVNKGKPVYFRALPPRDRKIIHQYLAEDGRVKSRSVGDGLFKKIKIYPVKDGDAAPAN